MTEKLKDYQVLDVLCGGTFYKVKHKVTNKIFAWKAYNCSAYSDEQIQNVVNEVKTISKVLSGNFIRYYDTILHGPSKTLYFVLEYNSWQSVQELIVECKATDKYFAEGYIWYLLLELARACKFVDDLNFVALQKCITPASIFVGEDGEVRINCFDLCASCPAWAGLMQQVGHLLRLLCYRPLDGNHKNDEFHYSEDLRDIVELLTEEKNSNLRPEVVLYHPTVLAKADAQCGHHRFPEILVSVHYSNLGSEVNKCDSEKAGEMCRAIKPLPRTHFSKAESPIYCNISPKMKNKVENQLNTSNCASSSPTLAALALELPGYVPRCRKPYSGQIDVYNGAKQVSEETLSQQWMSRLIAIRQREESLNKRERELIAKEIVNSPVVKVIALEDSDENCVNNGITLPPVISQGEQWVSRRRQRRAGSGRKPRRKSYAYEDLDSSLSADAGDGSMIVTAAKFTKENMPRRNIFPEISTKKVHFTASNPFVESDESVTLTFYELENIDKEKCPTSHKDKLKDITKFKYLDSDKISEKRSAGNWSHSSPSKQAKVSEKVFADITNSSGLRKSPSKTSVTSKGLNSSKCSIMSSKSLWSVDSGCLVSEGSVADRTRSSMRQVLTQTPRLPPELKKTKFRKSLLPFKTPFKFMSTTTKI